MKFADLYNFKPLHDIFSQSRVRQTASRITQMGKLGNYHATVSTEDVALFLYVLAASKGTRFVFETVMQEHELVNDKSRRFVTDLATLISESANIALLKKVVIGSTVSIIEYKDLTKEVYFIGDQPIFGPFEQFTPDFLREMADCVIVPEPVER